MSQFSGAARFVIFECLLNKRVELSAPCIGFDLSIPQLSIKFQKPTPKSAEFIIAKLSDLAFDLFNSAHCPFHFQRIAV